MTSIPYSKDDSIDHEIDGLTISLKPLIGKTEYKAQTLLEQLKSLKEDDNLTLKTMEVTDKLFDMFVAGWKHGEIEQKFPDGEKLPSDFFDSKFKTFIVFKKVFNTEVDAEEKKS